MYKWLIVCPFFIRGVRILLILYTSSGVRLMPFLASLLTSLYVSSAFLA